MTANHDTPTTDLEAPTPEDSDPTRRQFLAGAAAVAAARWEGEDYDPANADEWSPITGGGYETGAFTLGTALASTDTEYLGVEFGRDDFDEVTAAVGYDRKGPHITLEAAAADSPVRHGMLADLSPAAARELAGALYQAAWEYDHREVADHEL